MTSLLVLLGLIGSGLGTVFAVGQTPPKSGLTNAIYISEENAEAFAARLLALRDLQSSSIITSAGIQSNPINSLATNGRVGVIDEGDFGSGGAPSISVILANSLSTAPTSITAFRQTLHSALTRYFVIAGHFGFDVNKCSSFFIDADVRPNASSGITLFDMRSSTELSVEDPHAI